MRWINLAVPMLLTSLLLLATGVPEAVSAGSSSGVAVSQVYAGGGNSGASFTDDFVELVNRGSSPVDLTGWSLQYATASGTAWQPTPLAGTIGAGRYYLVRLAGGTTGAGLPTADATGTANLAATGGKVALVHDVSPLTCGAAAGSCSAVAAVEDLVGYGSATDYEGSGPAPVLTSTAAALRGGSGCTDTNSSTADFTTAPPAPRTSASPATSCDARAPPPAPSTKTVAQAASVDIDVQPVLSIALERPALSFGNAVAGETPSALSERITVVSNDTAGYSLTVRRTAFSPADLPLGLRASAPAGGQLGSAFGSGLVAIPVQPASELVIGSTTARSAAAGDVWQTNVGFTAPLPVVAPGHYTATVTYTVIER